MQISGHDYKSELLDCMSNVHYMKLLAWEQEPTGCSSQPLVW
jgi:hypothetical protein